MEPELQVVLTVTAFGALGGLAQALRSAIRFELPLPGEAGHWNTGLIGHVFIGALTGVVVVGFLALSDAFDLGSFFSATPPPLVIPDGAENETIAFLTVENERRASDEPGWLLAFLSLASISALSGFAGLALLDRLSKELEKRLGETEIKVQEVTQKVEVNARELLRSRGVNAMQEGNYKQATELFRLVLDDPNASEEDRFVSLGQLARAEKRLGNFVAAVKYCDHRVKLRPNHDITYYNRACYKWLEYQEDALDSVLADLTQSEEIAPGSVLNYIADEPDFKTLRDNPRFEEWKQERLSKNGQFR